MIKDNKFYGLDGIVQEHLNDFIEKPNEVIEKCGTSYLMIRLEYGLSLECAIKDNQILDDIDGKVVHLTQEQKEELLKKVREKIEFIRLVLRNRCPNRRIPKGE